MYLIGEHMLADKVPHHGGNPKGSCVGPVGIGPWVVMATGAQTPV